MWTEHLCAGLQNKLAAALWEAQGIKRGIFTRKSLHQMSLVRKWKDVPFIGYCELLPFNGGLESPTKGECTLPLGVITRFYSLADCCFLLQQSDLPFLHFVQSTFFLNRNKKKEHFSVFGGDNIINNGMSPIMFLFTSTEVFWENGNTMNCLNWSIWRQRIFCLFPAIYFFMKVILLSPSLIVNVVFVFCKITTLGTKGFFKCIYSLDLLKATISKGGLIILRAW